LIIHHEKIGWKYKYIVVQDNKLFVGGVIQGLNKMVVTILINKNVEDNE